MSEQRGAICGEWPRVGDLAWVTGRASVLYARDPQWFRVLGVRSATIGGWCYLEGYHADEQRRVMRLIFVRIEGLVLRRGV